MVVATGVGGRCVKVMTRKTLIKQWFKDHSFVSNGIALASASTLSALAATAFTVQDSSTSESDGQLEYIR